MCSNSERHTWPQVSQSMLISQPLRSRTVTCLPTDPCHSNCLWRLGADRCPVLLPRSIHDSKSVRSLGSCRTEMLVRQCTLSNMRATLPSAGPTSTLRTGLLVRNNRNK
ncbi:hypothetical protein AcV7_005880 [Taiwanofungus camphoratus]|nr:hypothetical protein AcV7_005880 [Antrodia cinnamomea]